MTYTGIFTGGKQCIYPKKLANFVKQYYFIIGMMYKVYTIYYIKKITAVSISHIPSISMTMVLPVLIFLIR